jgi:hypothetical protein
VTIKDLPAGIASVFWPIEEPTGCPSLFIHRARLFQNPQGKRCLIVQLGFFRNHHRENGQTSKYGDNQGNHNTEGYMLALVRRFTFRSVRLRKRAIVVIGSGYGSRAASANFAPDIEGCPLPISDIETSADPDAPPSR